MKNVLITIIVISLRFNVIELSQDGQSGLIALEFTFGNSRPISPTGARVYSWELE